MASAQLPTMKGLRGTDLVPESELLPPLRGRSPKEIFAAVVDYVWDPYRQDEVL